MDKESLEVLLVQGESVAQIAKRFGKDPSTVSYWIKKYGLAAVNREKHMPKGEIDRDVLIEFVEAGMTIAEIANEVRRSTSTVRHWLRRHGLRTQNRRGPRHGAKARVARGSGHLTATMSCIHHGETDFILEGRGYYRCKRCRAEAVARRRRKVKEILVAEAGGRCVICGYNRAIGALEFHHLDPSQKRMMLSAQGVAYALSTLRAEAAKCVLLCANCHVEVENGVAVLPVELAS